MIGPAPIRVPIEVVTRLSIGAAIERLLFGFENEDWIEGEATRDKVIVRRWHNRAARGGPHVYGEFQGNFTKEQDRTVLRGQFVAVRSFFLAVFFSWWWRQNVFAEAELLQSRIDKIFRD